MIRDNIVLEAIGMVEGRVVGTSIVPRKGKWFKETYIVTSPGRVIVVREPYILPVEPPLFDKPLIENSEATKNGTSGYGLPRLST